MCQEVDHLDRSYSREDGVRAGGNISWQTKHRGWGCMQCDHCPVSALRREKQGPELEDHGFYVREVGVQAKSGGKTVRMFKWGE